MYNRALCLGVVQLWFWLGDHPETINKGKPWSGVRCHTWPSIVRRTGKQISPRWGGGRSSIDYRLKSATIFLSFKWNLLVRFEALNTFSFNCFILLCLRELKSRKRVMTKSLEGDTVRSEINTQKYTFQINSFWYSWR